MQETQEPPLAPPQLRALDVLRRGRSFLLTGHVRPDGDCIGGQAALARVLMALGKEVHVVNADPPEPRFDYLGTAVAYQTFRGELPEHDVAVLIDFSDLSRTGAMEPALCAAPSKKVVIDHHIHDGEVWWDEAFVDPTASASGLLVYRVARALGVELDAHAARGVFTSLVTDTGWFRYSNTDAETLAVASEMVRHGVDPSELFAALFQRRSAAQPAYVTELLAALEYHADGRIAMVTEKRSGRSADPHLDSDEVLDILRSVEDVEVVLFLRELDDGTCKLSARSKTDYDVNALTRGLGGGGHKKASGATLKGTLEDARRAVLQAAISGFEGGPAD